MAATSQESFGASCEVECRRQMVLMTYEKPPKKVLDKDPLPIVELRPFVRKEWRREKSFAHRSQGLVNHCGKNNDSVSRNEKHIASSPSPSRFETISVSENKFTKESILEGSKSRMKLHPPAEVIQQKQTEYFQSLVPGFITRDERTKTTLNEIQQGDSPSRTYSCVKQALVPNDVAKQKEIRVQGAKMSKQVGRRQLQYLNPFNGWVCQPGSWQSLDGNTHRIMGAQKDNFIESPNIQRAKTPFYDHFDRKGTLPSIKIRRDVLKPREYKLGHAVGDREQQKSPAYTVGGIKNSLKLLSGYGTPTKVEQQLSFELEVSLSRFRKSRDFLFGVTPNELAKYYPQPITNLTRGELMIRKGLQSNTSGSRKRLSRSETMRERSMTFTYETTDNRDSGIHSPLDVHGGKLRYSVLSKDSTGFRKEPMSSLSMPNTGVISQTTFPEQPRSVIGATRTSAYVWEDETDITREDGGEERYDDSSNKGGNSPVDDCDRSAKSVSFKSSLVRKDEADAEFNDTEMTDSTSTVTPGATDIIIGVQNANSAIPNEGPTFNSGIGSSASQTSSSKFFITSEQNNIFPSEIEPV